MPSMQAGIDVGGTFTDLALWDGSRLTTAKVPTTPADQSRGVVAALRTAGAEDTALVHGTTVATNALLERSGGRTALVTDAGFEDLLEIGRQNRPSLYDVAETRPAPLVDRSLRLGVAGRFYPDSEVTEPATDLAEVVARLRAAGVSGVAVGSLFSFLHPEREREIASALADALPGVAMSLSAEVAPEFREFERLSTTVINAYLVPLVARYLENLAAAVATAGVSGDPGVMRSSGGLIGVRDAARLPAAIVLSGPAGGAVAAAALGTAMGKSSLISFDMGGTSTDACRIVAGRPEVLFERGVGGLPNRMPAVAVHTVGAGGGSLAWVDSGGALRVGPKSAGADPGPVSYGRGGTTPAVTDANLAIGRLGAGVPLAGSLLLDRAAAFESLGVVGDLVGMDAADTALGVVRIVEAHMERALRAVSVEQGADPRESALVAFGGAGAMHATVLAKHLDMAGVVVPPHAGVFSAVGLLLAPPRADVVRGRLLRPGDDLDGPAQQVMATAVADLGADRPAEVTVSADVRYSGQSHETPVPYELGAGWEVLTEAFHRIHETRNGFARRGDPIEVVAMRAAAVGDPALRFDQLVFAPDDEDAARGVRRVMTAEGESAAADVWWRLALRPGEEVVGPAVIEEPEATTYLEVGDRAVVHPSGALEVEW